MRQCEAFFLAACIAVTVAGAGAETGEPRPSGIELGPDVDIFFAQYAHGVGPGQLVFAAFWHDSGMFDLIPYPGTIRLAGAEAGFRFFLVENLHLEAGFLPQYVWVADESGKPLAEGFGLAAELRLGYRFDLPAFGLPFYLTLQFFGGCHIVNPRPESFKAVAGTGDFYWSPIPMFLFGLGL